MEKLTKRIELIANILIIVVAITLVVVLVKRFVFTSAPTSPTNVAIGTKVQLPGVDWSKNQHNLVLVLSTTCKFCTESAPFYQRLAQERKSSNDVRLLAVFHQPINEAQQYLNSLGVSVDDIKEGSLSSIGVGGTPTLLLVNSSGTVKGSWVGKLPPEKENEVIKSLL